MAKPLVIPAILEDSVEGIEEKVSRLRSLADERITQVQVDVVDGLFADNWTITPADLAGLSFSLLKLDFHLMVDDPAEYVSECAQSGPARIIAQIERMGRQDSFVRQVHEHEGVKAGLALDADTSLEGLDLLVLRDVDVVLLMGYRAGRSGQAFQSSVIEKIRDLRKIYEGVIQVDGGVNPDTIGPIAKAGADEVVVASFLWQNDIEGALNRLYENV